MRKLSAEDKVLVFQILSCRGSQTRVAWLYLTIENARFEIEWLAESNSSYSLKDQYDAVSVTKDDSSVDLKATMINKRKTVDQK